MADVSGARILIIDDNAVNRSILSEQMEAWRFEHAAVSSGREGLTFMDLAASKGLSIDLVILDYQMPEMSGMDVLEAMRSNQVTADLPVVMLTSVDEATSRSTLGDLRLEASLTKPARSSALLETITEVIMGTRGTLPEAEPTSLSDLVAQIATVQEDTEETELPHTESSLEQTAVDPARALDLAQAFKHEGLDILVAEDNEVNQMVFGQILETTGYRFKIVENGKLAVASWKVHKPRLILMDVSMPEMNGHDATKAIREAESGSGHRTPIIAVTAHAVNGDRETCFDAGMDDYLPKPISVDSLRQKLEQYLPPNAARKAS